MLNFIIQNDLGDKLRIKMKHKMFSTDLLQAPDYKHFNSNISIFRNSSGQKEKK